MTLQILSRWWLPAILATGLSMAALLPTPAKASDNDLVRVIVDVADVIYHSGQPYYRYGDYGYANRVVIVRDRYRRPTYYRYVPRTVVYRAAPPGHAYGHYRAPPRSPVHYVSYRDYDRYDHRDRRDHGRTDWNGRNDHRRGNQHRRGHDD